MSQINDCKLKALTAVYGPGQINDLMLRFLQAQGADAGTINDAWQQVINGGISPIPPPNAIADYDFSQFSPTAAITDKVTGQKVTTTRAGNLNVVQSDNTTIEAFGFNQAGFDRGVGMFVEKDSINSCINVALEGDAGNNGAPNSWNAAVGTGSYDRQPSTFFESVNAVRFIAASGTDEKPYMQGASVNVPAGMTITLSVFIEDVKSDVTPEFFLAAVGNAARSLEYLPCTANPNGGNSDFIQKGRLVGRFTTVSEGIMLLRFGLGVRSYTAGDITASLPQIELDEEQATSPIIATAVSASRPATIAEIPTIAELGYLIDEPSTATVAAALGDYNQPVAGIGVYLKGLFYNQNGSLGLVGRFRGDPGQGTDGKYADLLTNDWLNAELTSSNGARIKITEAVNLDAFRFIILSGTNADVIAGFEYPNEFTIDFTPSDFFTNNDFATAVSAIAVLRQNAGDILTGFATPSQWPEDNVRISFNAEVLDGDEFKYVFKMAKSSSFNADELILESASTTRFALKSRGQTGAGSVVNLPSTEGQHLFEIDFKDGTMLLRVDGLDGDIQTATLQVGARPKVFFGAANVGHPRVLYNNFTVQSPIPAPPPEISQLTVILQGAQGANPEDVFQGNVGLPDDPQGELIPALTVDGKPFSVVSQILPSTFGKGVIIGNDDQDWTVGRTIVASFGGVEYTFLPDVFGAGQDFNVAICLSETLYDYLFSVAGTPIDFSIVSVTSGALPFSASSGTQNYQYNDGLYAFYKSQGAQGDQLNDLAKDFWCRLAQPQIAPLPWILSDSQGNILTDNSGTNLRT